MKLILRGHHLLCLKGFQGYGYDDSFTENMTDVNVKRKQPGTAVTLVSSPDDICRSCPNLINNMCENEKQNARIVNMDNAVLKNFDTSIEHDSVELFDRIDDIFSTKESVCEICFNCIWHEKCLFYQNLSNNR